MATRYGGAAEHKTTATSAAYNGAAVTISAWVYVPTGHGNAANDAILTCCVRGGGGYGWDLYFGYGGSYIDFGVRWDWGYEGTETSFAFSTNTWYHMLMTSTNTGPAHYWYIDNSQQWTSSTGTRDTTAGTVRMCGLVGASLAQADLAEIGIWNRVITADERAALTAKVSPLMIPNGLSGYWPMHGVSDYVGNVLEIQTGTPSIVDHVPGIWYPWINIGGISAAGAAPPAAGKPHYIYAQQ